METLNGYFNEQNRNAAFEQGTRRREEDRARSAGCVCDWGVERWYERFQPITVRAAVRVVQLHRAGVVTAREARFYIRELAAMDGQTDRRAFPSLNRIARRHAAARPMVRFAGVDPGARAQHREPALQSAA